jgi:hypothetical protein
MSSDANERQLQFLLRFLCESVNSKIVLNSKLLRDLLDVVEGLMRGALNSNGNYDHASLKLNCMFVSENAQTLMMSSMTRADLLAATHREHAIPLKVLINKMYDLPDISPAYLQAFLNRNLVSVLLTKDEQRRLDAQEFKIRDQMPSDWDGSNVLARFETVGIPIIRRWRNGP